MKFKKNDKVSFKSHVSNEMLFSIGIPVENRKKQGFFWCEVGDFYYSRKFHEKGEDIYISFDKSQSLIKCPEAWLEPSRPRGHHLTNIFKDKFICSK